MATRRPSYRRCRQCRTRRTHARSGICLACRNEHPEVRAEPDGLVRVGQYVLSTAAATALINQIADTIERNTP